MIKNIGLIFFLALISSCVNDNIPTESTREKDLETKSEIKEINPLILACVDSHGGDQYDSAHFEFRFRELTYRFKNEGNQITYEREGVIKGDSIHDILNNGNLTRIKNGENVELDEEEAGKYKESINSVIYFATLPHKLKDEAVITEEMANTKIYEKAYNVLKVTFKQDGGGTDFEDEYFYWINQKSNEIDYLAYNYQVNGGGVRFRKAFNKRRVGGILFQDYVNYKAEVGTAISVLPSLLEQDESEELSKIETENIKRID